MADSQGRTPGDPNYDPSDDTSNTDNGNGTFTDNQGNVMDSSGGQLQQGNAGGGDTPGGDANNPTSPVDDSGANLNQTGQSLPQPNVAPDGTVSWPTDPTNNTSNPNTTNTSATQPQTTQPQNTLGPNQNSSPQNGGLGASLQQMMEAIASGNKAAIQEQMREFDATFGLDKDKFSEAVKEYGQNFGLSQAGVTGTYNGNPTLAAQEAVGVVGGQDTLAKQQQDANQAIAAAGETGTYNGQATQAAQKQAADIAAQQAALTGNYNPPQFDSTGKQIPGTGTGTQTLAGQLQQATLSGQYNGSPTESAREFNLSEADKEWLDKANAQQEALKTIASAQNDPFRQMQVQYGANGLLNGLTGQGGANALPKFGAMTGSAQGTGVLGMANQSLQQYQGNQGQQQNGPANYQEQTQPQQTIYTKQPNQQQKGPILGGYTESTLPSGSQMQSKQVGGGNPANIGASNAANYGWTTQNQTSGNPSQSNSQSGQAGGTDTANTILGQFKSPNDVIARNYITADQNTKNMVTSAISKNTGLDQASIDKQINSQLPTQAGPSFGLASI